MSPPTKKFDGDRLLDPLFHQPCESLDALNHTCNMYTANVIKVSVYTEQSVW